MQPHALKSTALALFLILTLINNSLILESAHSQGADGALKTDKCSQKRYFFDIGSSVTKSIAYTLDTCKKEIIDKQQYSLLHNYQYCLVNAEGSASLPDSCIEQGTKVLERIQQYYKIDCTQSSCFGWATAWARAASNTDAWLQSVHKIGVKVKVISQQEEGELALKATGDYASRLGLKPDDFLVWDVGGGSFQIIWNDIEDGKLVYRGYYSPYGTDNLTKLLIKQLGKNEVRVIDNNQGSAQHNAPVLFNKQELDRMIDFTTDYLGKSIQASIPLQKKLKQDSLVLLGNSMLMYKGLKEQLGLNKSEVTKEDLYNVALSLGNLKVEQIRVIYPKLPEGLIFSAQSSLILLYAVMANLNIDRLHIVDDHNDIIDYLALNASY